MPRLTQRLFHKITPSRPLPVHFEKTNSYSHRPIFHPTPIVVAPFMATSRLAKMSTKTPILTKDAPMPLPGICSQGIVAGGFVFCSGTVGMDTNGKIIEGDVKDHTVICLSDLHYELRIDHF